MDNDKKMYLDTRHIVQTPTFTLSILGLLALMISVRDKRAAVVEFVTLALAGAGAAIALWTHVERRGEVWGWRGLIRALLRPDKYLWFGLATHLPQLLIATVLALRWRAGRAKCCIKA